MPLRSNRSRRSTGRALAGAAAVVGLFLLPACQDPAGFPSTLESGAVSFSYAGRLNGAFAAAGRCYESDGYPAADSACALALDLGGAIRIRAVRDPRTIRWMHVNVEFPADGTCGDPESCRIAIDYFSRVGRLEGSYRSSEAVVIIEEEAAGRVRGTFSGRAYDPRGGVGDTIRIFDGAFDVPVAP
jgi:hypothetical protein